MSAKFTSKSLSDIKNYIYSNLYEFVVVCGYDNVGKGFVIDSLFENIPVFHPDYSLICDQVSKSGRWSFFMYFLDMYNQLKPSIKLNNPLVFDRSSLCGSVYNEDCKIAVEYSKKIKNIKAIHVLVTVASKEDYYKLSNVRDSETKVKYEDYLVYTERYRCYMDLLGIDYIEYVNTYNEDLGEYLSKVCGGCSHYKSGKCVNEKSGVDKVSFDTERCKYSQDKEVQDR